MLKSYIIKNRLEAGCDEAGRGCLAGPVFAAAVIVTPAFHHPLLNDSKKMSEASRVEVREFIEENALSWAVAFVDHKKIDSINILQASLLAMHKALSKLERQPEFILVDGNKFNRYGKIPHQCFVKGDGKYSSIAAASVLAKTYRDDYMLKLHKQFPEYGWVHNKGYPTEEHRRAIVKHGVTSSHRKSFRLPGSKEKLGELFNVQ